MPSYLWSGTLSFGLVTLPVHLVPAVETEHVSFTMLHAKDNAPLERKMVCAKDEHAVPRREQVRGFPRGHGKYVLINDRELASLAPDKSQSIEIDRFVARDDIDPLYYHHPYYLTAGKGAARPYALLVKALAKTGAAGIATFVMKEHEYLAAIYPVDDVLCLITLHFEREHASPEGIAPSKTRVPRKELKRLTTHIRKATRKFRPERIVDEYEVALMKLVRRKARKKGASKAPGVRRRAVGKREAARRIRRKLKHVRGS